MDAKKIVLLIKKLVKEEVRKTLKPMINEVLAEKYISVIAEGNKASVNSVFGESVSTQEQTRPQKGFDPDLIEKQRAEARKKVLAKLTDGNPEMALMYEGVEADSRMSLGGGSIDQVTGEIDDDDGVDISQFGF